MRAASVRLIEQTHGQCFCRHIALYYEKRSQSEVSERGFFSAGGSSVRAEATLDSSKVPPPILPPAPNFAAQPMSQALKSGLPSSGAPGT